MELLCTEGEQLKRAFLDPVFISDNRVLKNLLKTEEHYAVSSKYMDFQTDIKPYMRKVVTKWMLEVIKKFIAEIYFWFQFFIVLSLIVSKKDVDITLFIVFPICPIADLRMKPTLLSFIIMWKAMVKKVAKVPGHD